MESLEKEPQSNRIPAEIDNEEIHPHKRSKYGSH